MNPDYIIQLNKDRFYDYYADELSSTKSQPLTSKRKNLIKRVFDNYLLSCTLTDVELDKIIDFITGLEKTQPPDPAELLNKNTIIIILTSIINGHDWQNLTIKKLDIVILLLSMLDKGNTTSRPKITRIASLLYLAANFIGSNELDIVNPAYTDSKVELLDKHSRFITILSWVYSKLATYTYWIEEINIFIISKPLLGSRVVPDIIKLDIQRMLDSYQFDPPSDLVIDSLKQIRDLIISAKEMSWIVRILHSCGLSQKPDALIQQPFRTPRIIIDGANWFSRSQGVSIAEIRQVGQPGYQTALIKTVLGEGGKLGHAEFIYIVFNERHRGTIRMLEPSWHEAFNKEDGVSKKIRFIYTRRGENDDAMSLYLWLSNPESILLSRDKFSDWAEKIGNNQYLRGLWSKWCELAQNRE